MRILVADDDEVVRMILESALTAAGHEVWIASDGVEALKIMRERGCRLVISDWDMPNMNGLELCRTIRQESSGGYVYVIMVTGRDTVVERVQGLRAGADDFVSKPFEIPELLARIGAGERVLALETRDVAIFAMAKLAESRDPETGAHLERVRSYCRCLAQHMSSLPEYHESITPEFAHLIYLTSPLHDIGKVGIPDVVLLKPGRLSDTEFEIMKTHTTLGAQTLQAAIDQFPGVRFLQMARNIAATHHERWNGTGYPLGLRGENIPICGRIVALADVYDALTSKRVYKSAMTHEVARSMITADSGKHFDPAVVNAFIECEREFLAIRDRYQEAEHLAMAA